MTAKSVLVHPQGLRPRVRAPTCLLPLATPLAPSAQRFLLFFNTNNAFKAYFGLKLCFETNSDVIFEFYITEYI